jgi:thioredoxin 1
MKTLKRSFLLTAAAFLLAGLGFLCGNRFDSSTAFAGEPPKAAATNAPAKAGLPRLLDLGSDKCIPCKMMAPILKELTKEYEGQMEVEFLDVRKNPDVAKTYDISLIPTQIFYDAAGKELFRHEGFFSKEDILAKWKELGVQLKPAKPESKAEPKKPAKK